MSLLFYIQTARTTPFNQQVVGQTKILPVRPDGPLSTLINLVLDENEVQSIVKMCKDNGQPYSWLRHEDPQFKIITLTPEQAKKFDEIDKRLQVSP